MERETLDERETQKNVGFRLRDPHLVSAWDISNIQKRVFFKIGVFTMVQVQVLVYPRPSGRPYESGGNS
jgi:hypothetical protein